MTLDVEIPDPPTLSGPQDPGDYDAVDEPEEGRATTLAEKPCPTF